MRTERCLLPNNAAQFIAETDERKPFLEHAMKTIINVNVVTSDGNSVPADAHENNVAFACLVCGGPVLAAILQFRRGASEANPTKCCKCEANYWVEALASQSRLIVHTIQSKYSGRYMFGRKPSLTAKQNADSWGVISAMLTAYGGAEYEDLSAAVRQHNHVAGGRAFVDYCIRNGWLCLA